MRLKDVSYTHDLRCGVVVELRLYFDDPGEAEAYVQRLRMQEHQPAPATVPVAPPVLTPRERMQEMRRLMGLESATRAAPEPEAPEPEAPEPEVNDYSAALAALEGFGGNGK